MTPALRYRLTYGPIMLAALMGLLYVDWLVEQKTVGWIPKTPERGGPFGIAGVGVFILLMFLLPLATTELARLFTAKNVRPYRFVAGTLKRRHRPMAVN